MSNFLVNVQNIKSIDLTADILLPYELMLIEKLNFQLVVHTAYRPFEGLIIDLKVKNYLFVLIIDIKLFILDALLSRKGS